MKLHTICTRSRSHIATTIHCLSSLHQTAWRCTAVVRQRSVSPVRYRYRLCTTITRVDCCLHDPTSTTMQDQGQRRRACALCRAHAQHLRVLADFIIVLEEAASFATILLLQFFTLLGFIDDSVMHNNRKDEAREMRSSQNIMHCYRDTTSSPCLSLHWLSVSGFISCQTSLVTFYSIIEVPKAS